MGGLGAPGWFLWATLEGRNGECGDQTQVWREHSRSQAQPAAARAAGQRTGLQSPSVSCVLVPGFPARDKFGRRMSWLVVRIEAVVVSNLCNKARDRYNAICSTEPTRHNRQGANHFAQQGGTFPKGTKFYPSLQHLNPSSPLRRRASHVILACPRNKVQCACTSLRTFCHQDCSLSIVLWMASAVRPRTSSNVARTFSQLYLHFSAW